MAFKDGMSAIAKVLKVIAIGSVIGCFFMGMNYGSFFFAGICGAILFFLFWTPAWVIKKFIQ